MTKQSLSTFEKFMLFFVTIVVLTGFALFHTNHHWLDSYLEEDGLVEWLTVVGLMIGFVLSVRRFLRLRKTKSWWFLTVTAVLAVLLFIAAGEEISWGQRIFNIQSPEYFKEHNAQGETNIHNLVVGGVKINKLVFSIMLIAALSIYLVVIPILYNYNKNIKAFMDRSGVPIARFYQILAIVIVFGLASLLPHERNSELLEAGAALLFSLIIYNPKNRSVFLDHSTSIS
jgi:hypothetical protein